MVTAALLAAMMISTGALASRKVVVHKGPKRTTVVVKNRHVVRPHVVAALAPNHVKVVVKDRDYFFHAGAWYAHGPEGYRLITAPRGARVKFLPVGHTVVALGGVNYYYYYGAYYRFDDQTTEYYVVEPAAEVQTTDVLYLVDGDVLKGTYLGGDGDKIQFQVGEEVDEVDLTDIVSLSFEPPTE
jgi:hypothetical protein